MAAQQEKKLRFRNKYFLEENREIDFLQQISLYLYVDENPNCLLLKFLIPEKSAHISRFVVNRKGRRSTVVVKT